MILSEKSATPDQVRGGHFRGHALVPRTRSSHDFSAGTVANFGFKSGTRIIELLVSFSIPKFAQRSLRMLANFGIGTLALAGMVPVIGAAAHAQDMLVDRLEIVESGFYDST